MSNPDLPGLIDFLRATERLKTVTRSGYTSTGTPESVAEHTWRLSLMAMLLAPEFPNVDFARLIKICIIHDLGEAIGGDIPAPEQARRIAAGESGGKADNERRDLVTLVQPLPDRLRSEILSLWDEYEAAESPEAKLAKALDKLETILQHTQGQNPPDFDYRFRTASIFPWCRGLRRAARQPMHSERKDHDAARRRTIRRQARSTNAAVG